MTARIHPTAVVDGRAELADEVTIGPYCTLGPEVRIGKGTRLIAHVVVDGRTTLGADCTVYPFAVLGTPPQDLKYRGEASRLLIGDRTMIREHVTMNTGTEGGGMETVVGSGGLFMVGVHVAHDCRIGDGVIMANNATLGGHVTVGDHAVIGGLAAIHQFVRIGAHAMIGGMSGVEQDVIPFGLVKGERARLAGLNLVGLERRGFERASINALRAAYRGLFDDGGTFAERMQRLRGQDGASDPVVAQMIAFIEADSSRAICQPR